MAQPNPKPLDGAPLHGAIILDLADESLLLTGRYLADLGARVVRVEPLDGDPTRARAPFVDGEPGPERSLAHLLCNAGKQSLALDLDRDESWRQIRRIADAADVVIAPVEKSARMRELFASLGGDAPSNDGPRSDGPSVVDVVMRRGQPGLAVSDLAAVAAGGLLYCCGFPNVPPDYPVGKLGYKQGSYIAVTAAVAAIFDRRLRGRRASAEISLQEAVASTTIQAANQNIWRWWGSVCERAGEGGLDNRVLGQGFNAWKTGNIGEVKLLKNYGTTFATKDRQWVVFMPNPVRWEAFAEWYREVMGEGYGMGTEEWNDSLFRAQHREEQNDYFIEFCAALDHDELVRRGQQGRHYATPRPVRRRHRQRRTPARARFLPRRPPPRPGPLNPQATLSLPLLGLRDRGHARPGPRRTHRRRPAGSRRRYRGLARARLRVGGTPRRSPPLRLPRARLLLDGRRAADHGTARQPRCRRRQDRIGVRHRPGA